VPAVPPGKIKAIAQRYADGEIMAKIARDLRISASTVHRYTRDQPRRGRIPPNGIGSEIQALRARGRSYQEVASALGVCVNTVKRRELKSAATRRRTAAPASRHH
jgi:DNA-directed RNA polymerase specialized sigma24 family protein